MHFQNIYLQEIFSIKFSSSTDSGMHAKRKVAVFDITQDDDIYILAIVTLVNIILAS